MFSADRLAESLWKLGVPVDSARFCVAFSGGLDSSVLLHALAAVRAGGPAAVRALHVNHHLHERAAASEAAAAAFAARHGVAFEVRHAHPAVGGGASVEAAAREARYALFTEALEPNEYLVTAHHRDDQLETVLLQLLRGSGLAGLAAMPGRARFAHSWHVRPLLDYDRSELEAYAAQHALEWHEDPTNADLRFDRNYLRREIVPRLRRRWPAAAGNVARSAAMIADASAVLDELAAADVRAAADGEALRIPALHGLHPSRMRNALRHWIRAAGHRAPSAARLRQIVEEVLGASRERSPVVRFGGVEVRRYRDRLFLVTPLQELPAEVPEWDWRKRPVLDLGAGTGQLRIVPGGQAGLAFGDLPHPLRVTFRHGTVRLRPERNRPSRTLKQLFQDAGVVPWRRASVPLLFAGKSLVAVGDLWRDARFEPEGEWPRVVLQWHERPPLF